VSMSPLALALAGGAVAGVGVTVVLRELLPSHPDLGSALGRLAPDPLASTGRVGRADGPAEREGRAAAALEGAQRWLAAQAETLGLPVPRRELALTGQPVGRFVATKLAAGLLGLAFPPTLAAVMGVIGLRLPAALPAAASVAAAAVLFALPDVDARRRAAEARREFRRALCSYLDLVALERLADAGAVEALERAARAGSGWVFDRIRDALLRAQLAGITPWAALGRLAEEVGVPELGDAADIVALSGEDGAAVHQTLRARAAALRGAILADAQAEANAASEKLIAPVACLGLVFIALLAYPAFARILYGS
jgi:Type II secretion system (T2SS), protein F